MRGLRRILIFGFVSVGSLSAFAVEQGDIDSEIAGLRKELQKVQADRRRNNDELVKERKEFDAYRARTTKRRADIQSETESMQNDTKTFNAKRDSLTALVQVAQAQRRQVELGEDQLRLALAASCDEVVALCRTLPPLAGQQAAASAGLLKAELTSKSIDNTEGMNRIVQIFGRIEESTSSIQVSQESSPFAEMRGTVYRLRIGTFFEALVDLKGEKAAVWRGSEPDGTPRWRSLTDAGEAAMIMKAASIREGKALPSIAQLPVDTTGGAQ